MMKVARSSTLSNRKNCNSTRSIRLAGSSTSFCANNRTEPATSPTNSPDEANFFELLQAFVRFSSDAQGFLRRGWNEYRKAHERTVANVADQAKPEDLARTIKATLSRAAELRGPLTSVASRLHQSATTSKAALAR